MKPSALFGMETAVMLLSTLVMLSCTVRELLAIDTTGMRQASSNPATAATTHELSTNQKIRKCRHGFFLIHAYDKYVSKSLDTFGEWGEDELELFMHFIKPGDIVLDVGANIGAFTVPLANAVGKEGAVHAFEPQRFVYQNMVANVAVNGLTNVHTHMTVLGSKEGVTSFPLVDVEAGSNFAAHSFSEDAFPTEEREMFFTEEFPVKTLDSMSFHNPFTNSSCPSFIKIDVEFMELEVLMGATELLQRCSPIVYLENNAVKTSKPLIEFLHDVDYVPHWHVSTHYNPGNFFGAEMIDEFKETVSFNNLCIPKHALLQNGGYIGVGEEYPVVERDKPYLHDYFPVEVNGQIIPKFRQQGTEVDLAYDKPDGKGT